VIPEKLVPHFKPGKALRESVDAHMPVDDVPAEKSPATGT
jgi:integration host factor subunit beta